MHEEIATQLEKELHLQPALCTFSIVVESFIDECIAWHSFPLSEFCELMVKLDMSFDELYVMYIGKNIFNLFRQDHGYKEGTYHKIWFDKEDNKHLEEILNNMDKTVLEVGPIIYERLENYYTEYTTEYEEGLLRAVK